MQGLIFSSKNPSPRGLVINFDVPFGVYNGSIVMYCLCRKVRILLGYKTCASEAMVVNVYDKIVPCLGAFV